MSKKTFIITLSSLVLVFAGFAGWVLRGISGDAGVPARVPVEAHEAGKPSRGERVEVPAEISGTELAQDENLSRAIRALSDYTVSEKVRLDVARRIDSDLSSKDVDYLYQLLRYKPEGDDPHWWVVLNEIMQQMAAKKVGADRYPAELMSVIRDKSLDQVARDYAVQHLSVWAASNGKNVAPDSPKAMEVKQALDSIAAVISDPALQGTSIPGTAIMTLTSASESLPDEMTDHVWQRVDPVLTSMINGDVSTPLGTRTSVVQAVAMRGSQAHLPLIQALARDEKAEPSMRLTSIAALGLYRSGEDREYLESVANGSTRFRFAAQAALKKFQN